MSDVMGYIGKVVEFDPKNVYTKFCVNRTYGIGVMNFKVKKLFFFNYSAPIRPIEVKLRWQHLHTTSKQGAKFQVSTISCLAGICENISEEKK